MSELENNLIEKVKILILYGDTPVDGKDKDGKVERIFKEDDDTAYYFYIREFLQSHMKDDEELQKTLEERNDVNSVNHREAAFIASYFDIIFALNEQLHPGEKRLIQFAKNNCKILPNNFELNLMKLFQQQPLEILETLDIIIAELKSVLKNI